MRTGIDARHNIAGAMGVNAPDPIGSWAVSGEVKRPLVGELPVASTAGLKIAIARRRAPGVQCVAMALPSPGVGPPIHQKRNDEAEACQTIVQGPSRLCKRRPFVQRTRPLRPSRDPVRVPLCLCTKLQGASRARLCPPPSGAGQRCHSTRIRHGRAMRTRAECGRNQGASAPHPGAPAARLTSERWSRGKPRRQLSSTRYARPGRHTFV